MDQARGQQLFAVCGLGLLGLVLVAGSHLQLAAIAAGIRGSGTVAVLINARYLGTPSSAASLDHLTCMNAAWTRLEIVDGGVWSVDCEADCGCEFKRARGSRKAEEQVEPSMFEVGAHLTACCRCFLALQALGFRKATILRYRPPSFRHGTIP